jgi:hypothetical protein
MREIDYLGVLDHMCTWNYSSKISLHVQRFGLRLVVIFEERQIGSVKVCLILRKSSISLPRLMNARRCSMSDSFEIRR